VISGFWMGSLTFQGQVAFFFFLRSGCCPNLDQQGIGGSPHEGPDLQVLHDRLEEDLDLPAVLVDGCNRRGPEDHTTG